MISSLIDTFMPAFSLRHVDRVAVAASPGPVYAAARTLDVSQTGFVRLPLLSSGIDDITRGGAPRPWPEGIRR